MLQSDFQDKVYSYWPNLIKLDSLNSSHLKLIISLGLHLQKIHIIENLKLQGKRSKGI